MTASQKQFFVLVSGFVKADRRRGIDRVVRNILGYLLQAPPKGLLFVRSIPALKKKGFSMQTKCSVKITVFSTDHLKIHRFFGEKVIFYY